LNNASFQIGAAIGVAIVSTVAASHAVGATAAAVTEGSQAAFVAAIAISLLGLVAVALVLGKRQRAAAFEREVAGTVSA
jgi:putative effector of murein hydrolase